MHILAGETTYFGNAVVRGGFHHAPSAEVMWPTIKTESGETVVDTRTVNTGGVEQLYPAEPYAAAVVVGGLRKMVPRRFKGVTRHVPAENTMFPVAYDALAVLRSIVIAYESRDPARDELQVAKRAGVEQAKVVSWGTATMIDGKSEMVIKVVTDLFSDKIITAMPVVSETTPMLLDVDSMWRAIINGEGLNGTTKGGQYG